MLAQIYNEGIEDRVGTFETRPRRPEDVLAWFDGVHPIVVVEAEGEGVVAFASTSSYRSRDCYAWSEAFRVQMSGPHGGTHTLLTTLAGRIQRRIADTLPR